jgi:menaquinol-cytochrome c reductase iron-sulfur subunit
MSTLPCAAARPGGPDQAGDPAEPRRGFFAKAFSLLVAAAIFLPAALAGLASLLNPLRQKGEAGRRIRLATLDRIPEDGTPQKFAVLSDHSDAWTHYPREPIGAVFLRRNGPGRVEAFQVVCPHAGCFVGYDAAKKQFFCPCHSASFALDGKRLDATSPCPRGMDALEVEIRPGGEVWVNFQKFRTGIPQKLAES